MPSSEFGLDGEDATQFMYYPEFLPDAGRPDYLWGSKKIARTLVNPWDRKSSTKARRFAARCSAFALTAATACLLPTCLSLSTHAPLRLARFRRDGELA